MLALGIYGKVLIGCSLGVRTVFVLVSNSVPNLYTHFKKRSVVIDNGWQYKSIYLENK